VDLKSYFEMLDIILELISNFNLDYLISPSVHEGMNLMKVSTLLLRCQNKVTSLKGHFDRKYGL